MIIFTHVIQFDLIDMRSSLAGRVPLSLVWSPFNPTEGPLRRTDLLRSTMGPHRPQKSLYGWHGFLSGRHSALVFGGRPSLLIAGLSEGPLIQIENMGVKSFARHVAQKSIEVSEGGEALVGCAR